MAARAENFNGGWGGSFGPAVPWDEFDAMPWAIRRLYCFAAYDYTPISAFRMLLRGKATDLIVSTIRARLKVAVRREARRMYGPTHPQAQR